MRNIRNFAIIAHVDHGKSTLADRFLEITGVVKPGKHQEQLLDRNPISRERGITIKLAPVRMTYKLKVESPKSKVRNDFKDFIDFKTLWTLNLIDTPGHVDFSYEVERTLACVEGVILLVDATCGVQAQTIAHTYKILEQNLVIIPVINKIDLPTADIDKTKKQIVEFLGISVNEIYEVSAKTGQNVEKLLRAVIEKIPPVTVTDSVTNFPETRSLIFDSYYDQYRGVIAFVRVFEGELKQGIKVKLHATNSIFKIIEVGVFTPDLMPKDCLSAGEIGYVVTNLKNIHLVQVGDTIADLKNTSPLSGYRKVKPMVFASVFTIDPNDYLNLKKGLEKLVLNDAALTFEPIYSSALGSGFRVGFLGLLHADVVRERLEREFGLSLILTQPQVSYRKQHLVLKAKYLEPYVKVMIVTPSRFLGAVMRLCQDHRSRFISMDNRGREQACLFPTFISYYMPMAEMVTNFYDQLKSLSSGYASLNWEFYRYEPVEADKLEILLNSNVIEEFSEIVVYEKSYQRADFLVKRICQVVPRQQFEVRIQAKYKGRIIASERIAPFRKDVTQKLYGGDRTRKDKLLRKQKRGKKMLKNIGRVEIPKEAFLKLFRS